MERERKLNILIGEKKWLGVLIGEIKWLSVLIKERKLFYSFQT